MIIEFNTIRTEAFGGNIYVVGKIKYNIERAKRLAMLDIFNIYSGTYKFDRKIYDKVQKNVEDIIGNFIHFNVENEITNFIKENL